MTSHQRITAWPGQRGMMIQNLSIYHAISLVNGPLQAKLSGYLMEATGCGSSLSVRTSYMPS